MVQTKKIPFIYAISKVNKYIWLISKGDEYILTISKAIKNG
jgi:hypothetical protein